MKKLMFLLLLPFIPFVFFIFHYSDDIDANENWNGIIFERGHGFFGEISIVDVNRRYFDETNPLILPTTFNGRPVRYIAEGAFEGLGLTEVNFVHMRHLRAIGKNAFNNNQLERIDLTGLRHLELVEEGAFTNNSFTNHHYVNINFSRHLVIEEGAFDQGLIQNIHPTKAQYISKKY